MKKITIITLLFACLIGQAQNSMTYTKGVYTGDSIRIDTFGIDFSYIKDNNLLGVGVTAKTVVNHLIDNHKYPRTINVATGKAALYAVWNVLVGLSTTIVDDLYAGRYVSAGINENIINLFDVYNGSDLKTKYIMMVHLRHELTACEVGDTCIGIDIENRIRVGRNTIENDSIMVFKLKNNISTAIIDPESSTVATEAEINWRY